VSSIAFILGLDLASSPSAIVRFIVAVIIYAIYREFRTWPWSHIGKEVFKRMFPSHTNRYTATPVTVPMRIFFPIAAIQHSAPDIIFGSLSHSMCPFCIPGFRPFFLKASTTLGISSSERCTINISNMAANTEAFPNDLPLITLGSEG